jgi:hypothetical protein
MILGGIFLLNYGLQRDKIELNNATSAVAQTIRKAQDLTVGQGAMPVGCKLMTEEYPQVYSYPNGFGVIFKKQCTGGDCNNVSLFVDKFELKNIGGPDEKVEADSLAKDFYEKGECICETESGDIAIASAPECVENTVFPPTVKIHDLKVDGASLGETEVAQVFFVMREIDTYINYPTNYSKLEIVFCIKSAAECTGENIKTIVVNNQGMVWVKDE